MITTTSSMYHSRIDLPIASRLDAVTILNQRLADCIDLRSQCKQAHWNVKGANFIALHELFDAIAAEVDEFADLIAERVAQLGGIAEGTVGISAAATSLDPYPVGRQTGDQHVQAMASALAAFGRTARLAIDEMGELDDAGSADIMTEVSRGIDRRLWMVEAHIPVAAMTSGSPA
jgi:starvation-inducible DNA-binding protein